MSNALVLRNQELALAGPVGSIDAYIQAVNSLPVLSREDEQDLGRRLHEDNDLDAARTLVLSHLRFVVHVARGYTGYGLPFNDLVQEGNVGLMKAVKRFDPTYGVRLVSFAVHWIRAEIHEFVLRNWRVVKVATTKAQRKLFFNLRKHKKNLAWLSKDETEAVAKDLGVKPSDVTEMEQRLAARDLTFDPKPVGGEDSEGYGPEAYLPADDDTPEQQVANAESLEIARARLTNGLKTLDDRSRAIVERRWLTDDKSTLKDLAADYGVSAERIRQIEGNALRKLRQQVAG